ncbi:MAG TPA: ATP-binding protein, partial [Burkholderiales bacterium]|nr:ATP-binding protein [Burkholderiales bacterium]
LPPAGLARRFAFATAGLAAGAVLVVAIASWWLINLQQQQALQQLTTKETEFQASAVANDLIALSARMSEVASSTILATGLVDSAGRETYLTPFLEGIRQINGVPVQLLFTDFAGEEITRNSNALFSDEELKWLKVQLEKGRAGAAIFVDAQGPALVAVEPMVYTRTKSPEGGVLYKVLIEDLHVREPMRVEWGPRDNDAEETAKALGPAVPVPAPSVFEPLQFRVRAPAITQSIFPMLSPQYLPILLISLALFVMVVLAGMRLAHLLTSDLQRLDAFSKKFRSSGLSTARAPVEGSAEVASLAASINDMLDRLDAQHSALLKEQEKLTELADALTAADRRKDEFLATLAHELRNPLAPIKNSVTLLKMKSVEDPQLAIARDIIDRQLDQMSRLLDDLLDVSRITRNKLELRPQLVDLSHVLNMAVETSRPFIDAFRHELKVELPPQPVALQVDPVRLAQVFANLLNNSAKYTPMGGTILVRADVEGEQVRVSVKDNGMGIRPEHLPHIFEMFMQSGASLRQGESGLGIGLSLVRGLVEMHGGYVTAHSEGQGRGSEFVVHLTLAQPAAERRGQVPVESSLPRSVRRIVVADDNRDAADSLEQILKMWGHEVRTAYDGVEALELVKHFRPDVALLDIGMPNLNGYEVARHIREECWGGDVVFIALTGWGQQADKAKARDAGFDHHLVKPADPEELSKLLQRLSTPEPES